MPDFNTLYIGAGPAGRTGAVIQKNLGGEVLLVEKEKGHLGGECASIRCSFISKVVEYAVNIETMRIYNETMGLNLPPIQPNLDALRKAMAHKLEKGQDFLQKSTKRAGVEVVYGDARIPERGRVEVGGRDYTAKNVVVATGSRPMLPKIEGIDKRGVITYYDALKEGVPKRTIILGGGFIGAEYAYGYRMLGSEVTIVELFNILMDTDAEMRDYVRKLYEKKGIRIFEQTRAIRINGGERVESMTIANGKEKMDLEADCVILATGLIPNSEITRGIGVHIGDRNEILVDEKMATNVEGVWAAGDVTGPPYLTPRARVQALIAARKIMGLPVRTPLREDLIPKCALSMLDLAWVGLTEEEARKRGLDISVLRAPPPFAPEAQLLTNNRAAFLAAYDMFLTGFIKLIVENPTGKILGVHMAVHGSKAAVQYMAELMRRGVTAYELGSMVEIYPDNDVIPQLCRLWVPPKAAPPSS